VQVTFNDGDPVKAKVVGEDLSTDLAVIKVDPSDAKLTPLPLGDSSKAHVGDPVVAIGNPFGYDHTVTTGIVSAIGRQIQAPNDFSIGDAIQTDAAINPGNSGGPLIDANARVIGINSQIATNGGSKGNVGIGFAIPVNLAKQVLPQLIKTGEVKHAYIGVTTAPVTPSIADALKLPVDRGALVQEVASGSPASRAGIKAGRTATSQQGLVAGGDVIIGVDGKTIAKPDDVAAAIADNKPGDRVQIRLYRGKSQKTVSLTLGNRPERAP
jgi:S1-C subfamily serine protease